MPIWSEPETTPPISSNERVSPLNIILTSEVSDMIKLVSDEISTEVKYDDVGTFNDVFERACKCHLRNHSYNLNLHLEFL